MAEPLVSVVVPTFRRGRFLRAALESALAQTCGDLEVIVTDDASPDAYAEAVVADLGDRRVRVRRNAANLGQAGNNLAAFGDCRGRFVANLHDDDAWEPTFVQELTAPLLAHPDVALAFCDHWVMDDAGRLCPDATDANSARWGRAGLAAGRHQPFLDLAVVTQAVPMAMACLWRRSAVPWAELPAEVGSAYDYHLAYLAARDGAAAWYVPRRLTRYRVHGHSATAGRSLGFSQANVTSRRLILADPRVTTDPAAVAAIAAARPALRRMFGTSSAAFGLDLLAAGRAAAARPHLWAGLRHRLDLRAAVGLLLSFLPPPVAARAVNRIRGSR